VQSVRRPLLNLCRLIVAAALTAALPAVPLAQSAYKYRDANGQWVFTDRAASSAAPARDAINLTHEHGALQVSVERTDTDTSTQLIGVNECLCVVTLRVWIEQSDFAEISRGHLYQATLDPDSRQALVTAPHVSGEARLRYRWKVALGSPKAVHDPPRPYRAPFAVGETFTVTQAYPDRITHVTPDSAYAVDFALPDGTPVYAAREGMVINVRHDSFRGAPVPAMLDQANVIEILHDDGTIGVYAHLHWDSIRVHIGQRVARGEYIANSGNTGFTTGPHLHFAVWRNAGGADVSIPVQFEGIGGVPVTPATSVPLTAY
jgi:murein DD-endopeptidase MepM/ murein hydrolase activator NlpD